MYFILTSEETVRKVGQFPPPTVAIGREMERQLGETADLYRKALVNRNQGYGLGAVAYLRRVVEDKTNELIDIVADLAANMLLPDDEVEKIRASKNEKIYQEKLKVAAQVLPASLRPGGMNPLGVLHDLLSLAIHSLSEDECLGVADEIREVFDFVFTKLRAEVQDRRMFAENIQRVMDRRKKQ